MNKNKNSEVTVGFLSIARVGSSSHIGGYLLLNSLGRPTEFHCTEAVKPTRAQQILYGTTLDAYLYSDLLGKSLLEAAKSNPALIFVDSNAALDLINIVDATVLLVVTDADQEHGLQEMTLGQNRIGLPISKDEQLASIPEDMQTQISDWDLSEPFQRIHDAIQETQKAA